MSESKSYFEQTAVPDFRGRTAIVTGAAGGIGGGVARALAGGGASVVLVDRNADGLAQTAGWIAEDGATCHSIAIDLTAPEAPDAIVAEAVATFGSLHILVNDAAIGQPPCRFEDVSAETWDRIMAVNARAPFLLTQAAVPHLRGDGVVLMFASLATLMGFANIASYAASKGAVFGMTRALAVELAPQGIRLNAVAPGGIDTTLNGFWTPDHRAARLARTPAGRIGVVEDMVGPALFLLSDLARHVYGITLVVDGGYLSQADPAPIPEAAATPTA